MKETKNSLVPEEIIMSKIHFIRDQKVILDKDLAELYAVTTKQLKQAVRRNIERFPSDFMFELTQDEFQNLRSHSVTSSWGGTRYVPMAFTEQGVAMLSSVLRSRNAIMININIIRVFIKLRKILENYQELINQIEELKRKDMEHDEQILLIFNLLKQLQQTNQEEQDFKNRKRIGYKT